MNWVFKTFSSAIGKKMLMALTGLSFILFLTVHLIGNVFIYFGREAFNGYVEHLHQLGLLINVAELGLLALALVHVITGVVLFVENLMARPVRYLVDKRAGGRTWASAIMPYTGAFTLLFLIIHLINFRFIDVGERTMFDIVGAALSHPFYAFFYLTAVIVVGFHVSHGFWSAFQTLGLNHPKYMPIINRLGLIFAVVVGVGFGLIPIIKLVS